MQFLSNGQRVPFDPGVTLEGFTIKARRQWVDGYFYLAESSEGEVVIHESLAYFKEQWQAKIFEAVLPFMQEQGLCDETLRWFQKTWQKITLNFIVYPAWVWEGLENALQNRIWQEGYLEEPVLRQAYDWMKNLQENMLATGWVNPSVVLPMMLYHEGRFVQLEWQCSVPVNQELVYPRFFGGYHDQHLKDARLLAHQGCYRTFMALLQNKPPRFWGTEPMNAQTVNPLLSQSMRQWLTDWENTLQWPEAFPALPEQIYRPGAPLEDYACSARHFNIGFMAYQRGHLNTAIREAHLASRYWLSDPWPLFLLARCARRQNTPEAAGIAQQYLDQALRLQKLGIFYREKAEIALEQRQLKPARQWIEKALECAPQDDAGWHLYSVITDRMGSLHQAEKAIRKACALKPLNSAYRKHLIAILRQLGAENEALHTHAFAAGQPAHMSCEFTRSEHLPPTLQPPGPWKFAGHQNAAQNLESGYPVVHNGNGQKGFLKPSILKTPQAMYHFKQRQQILEQLYSHYPAGFASCMGSYVQQQHGYMIYDWKEGNSLQKELEQRGALSIKSWQQVALQAMDMLQALTQSHCVHGDISPANLIYNTSSHALTLVDYEGLHQAGEMVATHRHTPEYVPPELTRAHRSNVTTDSYSMALVLLQAATGLFPDLCYQWEQQNFEGYRRYAGHLPHALLESLLNAVHHDPHQRKPINIEQAKNILKHLRREVPQWVRALAQSIQQVAQAEDLETLRQAQQEVLDKEHSPMTYYHLAFHYQRLGAAEKAVSFANACLRLDPFHMGARWILVDTLLQQQQVEQARQLLVRAPGKGTEEPENYRRLLTVYCAQGKRDLALATCEQLEKCLPGHGEVQLEKASVWAHFGFFHQAADLLQHLLQTELPAATRVRVRQLHQQCLVNRLKHPAKIGNISKTVEANG